MIDGTTGGHLWAERYDRDIADIFAVQDEVTRTIVGALKVKLTPNEEAQRGSRSKINPEVYDLIVSARQIALQLRPESARQARALLERVIALDPSVAIAYARLAITTFAEFVNRWNGATPDNLDARAGAGGESDRRPTRRSRRAISRWRSCSPGCGGSTRRSARRSGRSRSIRTPPTAIPGSATCGSSRAAPKRPWRSTRTPTGSTRNGTWRCISSAARCFARPLRRGGKRFKRRLTFAPHSDMSRFYLACVYARSGRPEDAQRVWREILEINPTFSAEHVGSALPYRDPTVVTRLLDSLREVGIEF